MAYDNTQEPDDPKDTPGPYDKGFDFGIKTPKKKDKVTLKEEDSIDPYAKGFDFGIGAPTAPTVTTAGEEEEEENTFLGIPTKFFKGGDDEDEDTFFGEGGALQRMAGGFATGFATAYTGHDYLGPYLDALGERYKKDKTYQSTRMAIAGQFASEKARALLTAKLGLPSTAEGFEQATTALAEMNRDDRNALLDVASNELLLAGDLDESWAYLKDKAAEHRVNWEAILENEGFAQGEVPDAKVQGRVKAAIEKQQGSKAESDERFEGWDGRIQSATSTWAAGPKGDTNAKVFNASTTAIVEDAAKYVENNPSQRNIAKLESLKSSLGTMRSLVGEGRKDAALKSVNDNYQQGGDATQIRNAGNQTTVTPEGDLENTTTGQSPEARTKNAWNVVINKEGHTRGETAEFTHFRNQNKLFPQLMSIRSEDIPDEDAYRDIKALVETIEGVNGAESFTHIPVANALYDSKIHPETVRNLTDGSLLKLQTRIGQEQNFKTWTKEGGKLDALRDVFHTEKEVYNAVTGETRIEHEGLFTADDLEFDPQSQTYHLKQHVVRNLLRKMDTDEGYQLLFRLEKGEFQALSAGQFSQASETLRSELSHRASQRSIKDWDLTPALEDSSAQVQVRVRQLFNGEALNSPFDFKEWNLNADYQRAAAMINDTSPAGKTARKEIRNWIEKVPGYETILKDKYNIETEWNTNTFTDWVVRGGIGQLHGGPFGTDDRNIYGEMGNRVRNPTLPFSYNVETWWNGLGNEQKEQWVEHGSAAATSESIAAAIYDGGTHQITKETRDKLEVDYRDMMAFQERTSKAGITIPPDLSQAIDRQATEFGKALAASDDVSVTAQANNLFWLATTMIVNEHGELTDAGSDLNDAELVARLQEMDKHLEDQDLSSRGTLPIGLDTLGVTTGSGFLARQRVHQMITFLQGPSADVFVDHIPQAVRFDVRVLAAKQLYDSFYKYADEVPEVYMPRMVGTGKAKLAEGGYKESYAMEAWGVPTELEFTDYQWSDWLLGLGGTKPWGKDLFPSQANGMIMLSIIRNNPPMFDTK